MKKSCANRKLHSFSELGSVLGIAPRKAHQPPEKKCFRCGGSMVLVPNTNIYICRGEVDGIQCCNTALGAP